MQVKTVFNTLNANERKRQLESNRLPSMTIPDQSLTIPQLIARFTRGLPADVKNYVPVYNGENVYPDLDKLDLAEQQILREFARDQVKAHQEKIKAEIQARRDQEAEEFNKWKEEKLKEGKIKPKTDVSDAEQSESNK